MKKLSVVTSLYKSSAYIQEFYTQHLKCVKQLTSDYEFIFVDDGSPDDSFQVAMKLAQTEPRIRVLRLSRNFGQHAAVTAGLTSATGDLVYVSDCDLEEDPENILRMAEILKSSGGNVDVIYGQWQERRGHVFTRLLSGLFYLFFNSISEVSIPKNQAWQRLMSRRYLDALLSYQEVESLPAGLMALAGFTQVPLAIQKKYKGSSSYTFRKRLALALNSLTAFSSRPLEFIAAGGIFISFTAFFWVCYIVIRKLTNDHYQAGWISAIASIWLVGGLILSSVGAVGVYMAKIYNQVKHRPRYIIRDIFESPR